MVKIETKSQNVTPFAGVFFINEEFKSSGIQQMIDTELGVRSSTRGYSYGHLFKNRFNIFLCGGECAEDIHEHLRPTLEQIPGGRTASPDTLLRFLNELSTENTQIESSKGKRYEFNINTALNDLNIKLLIKTGQLNKGACYDFDYDNQIIEHEKWDAKATYKKNTGYFPGIATIGDKIVYIENRVGNANVKTAQSETLERAYSALQSQGIHINRSRMDAGSYSEEIIKMISRNSRLFYVRANKCESLSERIRQIDDWKEVEINDKKYEVASLAFTQFLADRGYRLVVMREKRADPQMDIFDGEFTYRCILTNDHHSSEQEVIEYYNLRGASEKIFDIQNNDFGWNHLPSSNMPANTVYMILTAMIKKIYNYIIKKVSKVFKDLKPTSRLKGFIFRFISVAGKWIYQGRQWRVVLYTDRPYGKVFV